MEQLMRFIVSLLLVLFVLIPPAAKAQMEVDLALVLAVDMSGSMDPEEQMLQHQSRPHRIKCKRDQQKERRWPSPQRMRRDPRRYGGDE